LRAGHRAGPRSFGDRTLAPLADIAPDLVPDAVLDARRLAAVRASGLLDSAPEEAFDRLARLAASLLGTPLAFVTVVDDRRSYWKSCIGLDPAEFPDRQMPVEESLCQHGVGVPGTFVVEDTHADPRTRHLAPVVSMGVSAWASVPVVSPAGLHLGSFCVGDLRPRAWTADELQTLQTLADAVSGEIALRDSVAHASALAASLQESLLPPRIPAVPGFALAAHHRPAGDGGALVGDFYDVFESSPGCWHVLMGDVCGHGLEAAKLAAHARYDVRAAAGGGTSPSVVLERVNTALLARADLDDRFMSVVFMTLAGPGEPLTLASAGHPPPLLIAPDGRVAPVPTQGTVLACVAFPHLEDVEVDLAPGATLLLYTDGVTEAGAGAHRLGEQGLIEVARAHGRDDVAQLAAQVDRAAGRLAGPAPADDAAVLVVRRS
jgi:sigma-B regulation protein RsbU (phosphoserine phosphatase)